MIFIDWLGLDKCHRCGNSITHRWFKKPCKCVYDYDPTVCVSRRSYEILKGVEGEGNSTKEKA